MMDCKATIASVLRDGEETARCRLLAGMETKDVDRDILHLLLRLARADSSVAVRIGSLRVLESFWPEPEVVRVFRTLATDDEIQVADQVAGAMARLRDDLAQDVLLHAYLGAKHFGYKWLVFEALTTAWSFTQIERLVMGYFLTDTDEVIRSSTVAYLHRQHVPAIEPDLERLLTDSDARVRANALEALCDRPARMRPGILERMVTDPSTRVQCVALAQLHRTGFKKVDDRIRPMASDPDERRRASAAFLVRTLPDLPGRDRLMAQLAADPSPAVRRQLSLS